VNSKSSASASPRVMGFVMGSFLRPAGTGTRIPEGGTLR
jgi:hypothetical protein